MTMRQAQVHQAAAAVGLNIDLGRIATMPNTADAHRLFERVSTLGNATQREMLLERLFAAYFRKEENLGCRETLLAIARSCGIDADTVQDCLTGDATPFEGYHDAPSGVPSFQFDRRLTIIGAQPAQALLGAMNEAIKESELERQPA
jgi:predicted DsbA family dithiol-disulfide isomerase